MIKGLIVLGIVGVLVLLGISVLTASMFLIYVNDNPNEDNYSHGLSNHYEQPIVPLSTNNGCYDSVKQTGGCGHLETPEQVKRVCYKTVQLPCGKTKQVETSCFDEVKQYSGCGHLETPEQVKRVCYKTVHLPCGKTMQAETSCFDSVHQERGYSCYDPVSQERGNCEVIAEKTCG
jgi:hypothetical protein